MESIRDEAIRYGIPEPELEHRERSGDFGEVVVELTPESEREWSDYLRQINMARLAFYSADKEL